MNGLFSAAIACFAVGGLIDLVVAEGSLLVRRAPYWFAFAGSACLVVLGVHATTSTSPSIGIEHLLGLGSCALRIDPLAGLFLTLLFGIAVTVSLCFVAWVKVESRVQHRGVASGYLLLLASTAVILTASDAFLFLFAWELLTVALYLLTSVSRQTPSQVSASWATLGMGKVSGAALLVGFLLLAGHTGSLSIASWHAVGPGPLVDAAWVLVIVGFVAKLGLVPFQVWIPVGYTAAPGPARAAMAGIAANVGVYGLWRFLSVLVPPPTWLAIMVLLAGGITALLGITFAGVQSGLARLIAYSSVENAGLIVTAFGIALTGDVVHSPMLVAVGLLAATLQMVTHAVAKSALFTSLANIEAIEGTDDLDQLRGVGHRLCWSGTTLGLGAVALAGLPPTIGFVSEWFIFEAFMQQFRVHGLALRLGLACAAALVALTAGLAALVFLRVLALTVLGRSRTNPTQSRDVGVTGKIGMATIALGCFALASLAPWEIRFISEGLRPVVPRSVVLQALKSPWVLQPVFPGFSILSPSWLYVVMPLMLIAVVVGAIGLSRGGLLRTRRVPSWHSATSGVRGPSSYTSFGFANPLRHVLANLLGARRTVEVELEDPDDPDASGRYTVETQTTIIEPVETYLYRPLRRSTLRVSRFAKRLQSGRLGAYVAYMLLALLAVLALAAAMR